MYALRRVESVIYYMDNQYSKDIIMALLVQLILAGPIVRAIFRKAFPVGKVLAYSKRKRLK